MSSRKPTSLATQRSASAQRAPRSNSNIPAKERTRTPSRDSAQCTSPTKVEGKKLPPIKAPVGLAKNPDLKNVRSKIGSLQNVKHQPAGGEIKVVTQKLDWQAKPRIGSLEKTTHKPGGGEIKVMTQKLDWKAKSKIGSLENVKHRPGGGAVRIFDEKYTGSSRSSSEARSPNQLRSHSPHSTESNKSGANTPVKTTGSILLEPETNGHNGRIRDVSNSAQNNKENTVDLLT